MRASFKADSLIRPLKERSSSINFQCIPAPFPINSKVSNSSTVAFFNLGNCLVEILRIIPVFNKITRIFNPLSTSICSMRIPFSNISLSNGSVDLLFAMLSKFPLFKVFIPLINYFLTVLICKVFDHFSLFEFKAICVFFCYFR